MSVHRVMTRMLQNATIFLSDSIHLTHQFLREKPSTIERLREILRKNASYDSGSNTIAYTLLKLDREIVFLRYKGFILYMSENFMAYTAELKKNVIWFYVGRNTSKSETARFYDNKEGEFDANYSSRASSKVGKVAFMITSQQKRVLRNMEFTEEEIKSLKPSEALLIVENGISAQEENWKQKVLRLLNEEKLSQSEHDKTDITAGDTSHDVDHVLDETSEMTSNETNFDNNKLMIPNAHGNETVKVGRRNDSC